MVVVCCLIDLNNNAIIDSDVQVFREPLYKRYTNSIFSFAFLFRVTVIIGIIVIPFVIAYVTHGK